jgi:hypothetical protein
MKLLYIEQHSMKLGDSIFYTIESRRQKYLSAIQSVPMFGAMLGTCFFIGFAIYKPITSKLYKEILQSFLLGCMISAAHPLYLKMKYMEAVSDAYGMLKNRFKKFPHLEVPDTEHVQKNFGLSKWNNEEVDDDEDIALTKIGLFEGDENSHRNEIKAQIYDMI